MNESEYCEKVRRMAAQRGKMLDLGDIKDTLDNALSALSIEAKATSDYPLAQKEYTVTMTAGVVDLSAIPDVFVGHIESVLHPDIDGAGTASYLSSLPGGTRADLIQSRNGLFKPYVVEKNALYASLGLGTFPAAEDRPPDSALVKVVAPRTWLLNEVPFQLQDRLIEKGLAIALGGMDE